MLTQIPNRNRTLVQKNDGDSLVDSNIVRTWNIDTTTNKGTILVSPRLYEGFTSDDDAAVGLPVAFTRFGNAAERYWAVCGSGVARSDGTDPAGTWQMDATAGTPTTDVKYSDITEYDGTLMVSTTDDVAGFDGVTWDATFWSGTLGVSTFQYNTRPHPMEWAHIGSPILCVGDGNYLHTMTWAGTITQPRLTLQEDQIIRWIKSGAGKVYIGTTDQHWQKCYIYEWDGGDTVPTRAYPLGPLGAIAGYVLNDVLYIITIDARIRALSGAGFVDVARWPIANEQVVVDAGMGTNSLRTFVHPRGVSAYKGRLLINASFQIDEGGTTYTKQDPNTPSGVWEFDPDTGSLMHKYGVSLGDDYGQMATPSTVADGATPGAIFITTDEWYSTPLLVGASVYTDAGTTIKTGIQFLDSGRTQPNIGSVTYPKIYTDNILDTLDKVVVQYQKMSNADDIIRIKCRVCTAANLPFEAAVTWASSTSFTSTDANWALASVGNEVEVIMGKGGGITSHIATIAYNNPTYTITLAQDVLSPAVNDEGIVRVDNWKFLAEIGDQIQGQSSFSVTQEASAWAQVKVELWSSYGKSPALERTSVVTKTHTAM